MNKKLISLGLFAAFVVSSLGAIAETTIYTDGIGRLHFLGKDSKSNRELYNYNNSAAQDLTRKLYEGEKEVNNDESFDQHPLKNYENTFPDFRYTNLKRKYRTGEVDTYENYQNSDNKVRASFSSQKGVSEAGSYTQTNTQFIENNSETIKNTIKDESKKVKKNKKKNKKKDK